MAEELLLVGDPERPSQLTIDPKRLEDPLLVYFLDYWRHKRGAARLP